MIKDVIPFYLDYSAEEKKELWASSIFVFDTKRSGKGL